MLTRFFSNWKLLLILFIVGNALWVGSLVWYEIARGSRYIEINALEDQTRTAWFAKEGVLPYEQWAMIKYGRIPYGDGYNDLNWRRSPDSQKYSEAEKRYYDSPEYKKIRAEMNAIYEDGNIRRIESLGFAGGILLLAPFPVAWIIHGLVGGWKLTIKRITGTWWWLWLLLFGLIPILGWVVFMGMMGLLGPLAYKWGNSVKPSKRRCAECRAWNDYQATRCQHCGQPLPPIHDAVAVQANAPEVHYQKGLAYMQMAEQNGSRREYFQLASAAVKEIEYALAIGDNWNRRKEAERRLAEIKNGVGGRG